MDDMGLPSPDQSDKTRYIKNKGRKVLNRNSHQAHGFLCSNNKTINLLLEMITFYVYTALAFYHHEMNSHFILVRAP